MSKIADRIANESFAGGQIHGTRKCYRHPGTPYYGPGGDEFRRGSDLPDGLELDSADLALELPPERARLRLRQIVRQCSRKGWKHSAAAQELLAVSLEYLRDVE